MRSRIRSRLDLVLAAVLMVVLAAAINLLPGRTAAVSGPGGAWLVSWAASPAPPDLRGPSLAGFANQTLREIVQLHFGGGALRVWVTNAFGSAPLAIGRADVALRGPDASVVPGTDRQLTFGGRPSATVPAGTELASDPASLFVEAGWELAVSLFLPEATGPATRHSQALATSYVAPGDHASDWRGMAFTGTITSWYFVSAVDVVRPRPGEAVVALGDSITDGAGSRMDGNARWPDMLARRLNARAGNRTSVVDAGIGGNRLLEDSPCCGVRALARLDRDALSLSGVHSVIVLEGINDIGFSQLRGPETAPQTAVSADQIIAGYLELIARAHGREVQVYAGTLTPFKGAGYATPAGLAKRSAVNEFIRTSAAFDGVIDFDRALRDPRDPEALLPAFDSGDHLHPNDAGYRAMAAAVPLSLFATPAG